LYGVGGAVWVMVFICPYCHFHGTRSCRCGYGKWAARLRSKKDGEHFERQFRRHIPVIVPLWFIPAITGMIYLVKDPKWELGLLTALFCVNSFVILPMMSRSKACAECAQRDSCPWMRENYDDRHPIEAE